MTTKAKKESYISVDGNETNLLRRLSFRERWLYMELKWLANFKTGKVGRYRGRVIDYTYLAGLVSVPACQGRAAETVTGGDIKRMLDHLQQSGLVGEVVDNGKDGLTFYLLASPIVAIEPDAKAEKLQAEPPPSFAAKPQQEAVSIAQEENQPILMSYGHHNTFFNNDSIDGAGKPAPLPAGGGEPAAGPPEDPPVSSLTLDAIRERLRESWFLFNYLDTKESQKFFERWILRGYTTAEFETAVGLVEIDDSTTPTPAEVERRLISLRHPPKRSSQNRGRVAL